MNHIVEHIKKCVADKVKNLEEKYIQKGEACNLISELDELHTKIILASAFG
jgi:hypothetical protein